MDRKLAWFGRNTGERPSSEQQEVYDLGRKRYLMWHGLEGQKREIIDFDLHPQSKRSMIGVLYDMKQGPTTIQDRRAIVGQFEELCTQFKKVPDAKISDRHLWHFARASVDASLWFAMARKGDDLDPIERIVHAASVEKPLDEKVPGAEISTQKKVVEDLLVGLRFERQHPHSARVELLHAAEQSRLRLQAFTGDNFDFPYRVEGVNVEAYWRAWTMSDPEPGERGFLIRQNAYWPWPEGKAEELGWHERHHVNRMGRRQEELMGGQLNRFFGITTVHGPESAVEEGLAQTITKFIPGAYESLTRQGKFWVEGSILRQMVYLNAQLNILDGTMTIADAVAYVNDNVPWELEGEVAQQIEWRTKGLLNPIYLPQYGMGAHHFLRYSRALTEKGKREFLRRLFLKPYTLTQTDALAKELSQVRKYAMTPLRTQNFGGSGELATACGQ